MRFKLGVLLVVTAFVLAGCSRLDALHVENPCDFPVTVQASGQTDLAVKTLRPGSESVVLEGFWRPDHPDPLRITTVEIAYFVEADMSTLPDVRISIPPSACERSRRDVTPTALVDVGWNDRASTVSVVGPTDIVDTFAAATASLTDAATSLEHPTDHAAELRVWPNRAGTGIVEHLLRPLFELEFVWVYTCQAGSACRNANVVGDNLAVPTISLPAAERSGPWAAPSGLLLLVGAGAAIWGSTRHRRMAQKARNQGT